MKLYCVICYGCFDTMKYPLLCSDACNEVFQKLHEAGAFKVQGYHPK